MGKICVSFNVKHYKSGVCDRLTKEKTGILVDLGLDLLVGHIGRDKTHLDAKTLQRDGKEIDGAAVDRGHGDKVLTCRGDVENGKQACGLTGGHQHCTNAALHVRNLCLYASKCGVGDTGVHVAVGLEVEQITDVVNVGVFVGGALHDREHAGLAVCRLVARLYAFCIDLVRRHERSLLGNVLLKYYYITILQQLQELLGDFLQTWDYFAITL